MTSERIVFLHIPKTAGQSVHEHLLGTFGKECICPARVNEELVCLSLTELKNYRVYSGHFDWSSLDCVDLPKFVFTVLREPADRILSFYFFLRAQAGKLSEEALAQQWYGSERAALKLSADDYFTSPADPWLRSFVDSQFDNFYTYYFAGRTYNARQRLIDEQRRRNISDQMIVDMALANMGHLDRVYRIDELDALEDDLARIAGGAPGTNSLSGLRINVGEGDPASRLAALRDLGATKVTFDRLADFVRLDRIIWQKFAPDRP